MKKFLLLLFVIAIITGAHAQNYIGIRNSNYAGILGATLNPSSMIDSKLNWDINLASGTGDFDNDFLYIPKDSLKFFGFGHIADLVQAKHYYTRFDPNNPTEKFNFTLN